MGILAIRVCLVSCRAHPLVNGYRGTGTILMAPTLPGMLSEGANAPKPAGAQAGKGFFSKALKSLSKVAD